MQNYTNRTEPGAAVLSEFPETEPTAEASRPVRTRGVINIVLADALSGEDGTRDRSDAVEFLGIENDHGQPLEIGEIVAAPSFVARDVYASENYALRITAEDLADEVEYRLTIRTNSGIPSLDPHYVIVSEERFNNVVTEPVYDAWGDVSNYIPLTRAGYPVENIVAIESRPRFDFKKVTL